jgi:hypothetical protein
MQTLISPDINDGGVPEPRWSSSIKVLPLDRKSVEEAPDVPVDANELLITTGFTQKFLDLRLRVRQLDLFISASWPFHTPAINLNTVNVFFAAGETGTVNGGEDLGYHVRSEEGMNTGYSGK